MAQPCRYACTKCLQWCDFSQLSEDKQICSSCTAANTVKESSRTSRKSIRVSGDSRRKQCKYCQTDNIKSDMKACERCLKNLKEHGVPKVCVYCNLQSAFIGSKCQRCSSSQKKYGPPVNCHKCNAKSAFDHSKARIDGLVLCWLCYVTMQRDLKKAKRKAERKNSSDFDDEKIKKKKYSPSHPYLHKKEEMKLDDPEDVWKELFKDDKSDKPTSSTADASPKQECDHDNKAKHESSNSSALSSDKTKNKNELLKQAQINRRKHRGKRERHSGEVKRSSLEERLVGMKKTFSAPNSPAASSPILTLKKEEYHSDSGKGSPVATRKGQMDNSSAISTWKSDGRVKNGSTLNTSLLPAVNDANIVVVTKLREELSILKKQLFKKDQQLIEKDKQISVLKVEHITEVRNIQAKLKANEEEYIKNMEALRSKNQELLKKIAQISKGKA